MRCNDETDDIYATAMVKAYTFGDRFVAPRFQRLLLERLVRYFNRHPCSTWFHATAHAFKNLPEKSPMLRALVDVHCLYYANDEMDDNGEEFAKLVPAAFWRATSEKYSKIIRTEGKDWMNRSLNPHDYRVDRTTLGRSSRTET